MNPSALRELKNTAPLFDKPFTLSMGPQRAGTSWIDRYLRARGDICMPAGVKELYFFDKNFESGPDFYASHFHTAPNHRMIMEVSTTSFDHPRAPKRVHSLFGDNIRLLCPLRHPVARSWSLYQHYKRYGFVTGTLQEACSQQSQILTSSHYSRHIQNWAEYFGRSKIQIIFQEDLEKSQGEFVSQLCNLLQIPMMLPARQTEHPYNVSAYSRFPVFARFAYNGASLLRKHRLFPIINIAKNVGLKRLILGTEKPEIHNQIPLDDKKWLEDRLSGEIARLETLIGPIPQWRE